ncbi:fatty acid desaturase [Anthocerotibacter panamensis]|uniref:fatty acid desaturase n=1 Tax=Anthocerotibacter panamensis TaxID=2857077 RepID=UPI001C406C85|nr:fatty acid desaturase [Anthocerotibacter panamensis]
MKSQMRAHSPADQLALCGGLKRSEIIAVIPKACFECRVGRQLWAIATSLMALTGAELALWINPFPWLLPVLWFLAGTAAWGLFVIGHECGHGSFSTSRPLNYFFGHLLLTPLVYPFHSWRLLHDHHHAHTNSLEQDIDWRPVTPAVYRHLPPRPRAIYRLIRTSCWWAGTLHQWATMAFDLKNFPQEHQKEQVRFSIGWVVIFTLVFFPVLTLHLGVWGVVKYWLIPWLLGHAWFSTITLMHHTHPQVPFWVRQQWSPVMSNLASTIYCRYPRWLEFLVHDINVHIPHHMAPTIPFYHLRRAHCALRDHYPTLVREERFSGSLLWKVLSTCHLYDRRSGAYLAFPEGKTVL